MKTIMLIFSLLISFKCVCAQETLVTYKVTNFEINGETHDNVALENDIALSFYMCDADTLCFANHWRNSNTHSYGKVYSAKFREIPETDETYRVDEIKFTWYFYNSYDNNQGEAAVSFMLIFIGNTVKFHAEILVLKTNDLLVFRGYQE
jgi:hypothetical protein